MSNRRLSGRPLMIVVSSPSGGGKSTLCRRLLKEYEGIAYSISCTTRSPRGEERDGKDYHFMDRVKFLERINSGEFLEYAEVHGNFYGTLKSSIEKSLESGQSVILDIDVQGAGQIRTAASSGAGLISKSFVDIFITTPSIEELKRRLQCRGEDSPETIDLRLKNAEIEMRCAFEYKYVIENNDIDRAYSELKEILEKESNK